MLIKSFAYFVLSKIPYANINKNLRVIAYHTVPDSRVFRSHLLYLKKYYNVISIFELKQYLFANKPLPAKAVLITFDDGDYSVYQNGVPVLKELNLPSVLFIITGLINTEKTFWCRRVENVLQEKGLTYQESRSKVRELKQMTNIEREQYLKTLPPWKSKQLTGRELFECKKAKMFIANHTHNHPMIDNCSTDEVITELKLAKETFDDLALEGYSIFAYPNGNFTEKAEKILMEHKVKMAFLFDHNVNSKNIHPFRISRIMADTNLELNEFKVRVSGLHKKLINTKRFISS